MNVFPDSLVLRSRGSFKFWSLVFFLLSAGLQMETAAQSGRHNPNQPAASPARPTPSPLASANSSAESSKTTTTAKPKEKFTILFARQPTSKHLASEDLIAASFFKRLAQYESVNCISIGDLKQSKAVARAKSELEALVVLLKFDINSYQSGNILLNSPDLEVEYFALAPRTGRKHAKGKIFFQTIGSGRMQKSDWPNGTPIKVTPEAAGVEAAETLYQLLSINAPRIHSPEP